MKDKQMVFQKYIEKKILNMDCIQQKIFKNVKFLTIISIK